MKKYILILFIVSLFSFTHVHKFYVSVTDMVYSEKHHSIQITSRYFIDDFEKLLKERYAIDPQLMTEKELKNVDFYIEKYLNDKFIITINGEQATFNFIGKEYDVDVMKCYLEIQNVDSEALKKISIQNKVLFEIFPEQQNVVHTNINGKKRSFMLIRENDKALLNL
ncbi:hypothetical protein OOZ15_10610 [Galbibacter sp. EGI 63066]|uniref:DUF6702 family protein n=1 Tax=Galbibacter sp. EGI 63066 TaxID=2993559 RepID=UPI002248AD8C|nr:DUF6702 family protein [Galbibacter sp. EGI 63066]MCX2680393.1 hypothetical protein [Galbibacter sp. EGI 63066]